MHILMVFTGPELAIPCSLMPLRRKRPPVTDLSNQKCIYVSCRCAAIFDSWLSNLAFAVNALQQ